VQPARAPSRDSTHTLFREARDAHNPLGAPEEESTLRGLQEEEEQEVRTCWRPWDELDDEEEEDDEDDEEEEEEDADSDEDV